MQVFVSPLTYDFFGQDSKLNTILSKNATSIETYSTEMKCPERRSRVFLAPKESLTKKFRWFYTHYSFKTEYKKLNYEPLVPVENYLSREEQILYTQGDFSNYKLFNGGEMLEHLNQINENFTEWYARNCFETFFEYIKKQSSNYDLDTVKEKIYKKVKTKENDINAEKICLALNAFYATTYFSQLYKTHKNAWEKAYEESTLSMVTGQVLNVISYEVVIPGEILTTNAPIIKSDTLIWKVDGMRLLFDDYALTAEYRVINTWSFIVTGLILLVAVGNIIFAIRRRIVVSCIVSY